MRQPLEAVAVRGVEAERPVGEGLPSARRWPIDEVFSRVGRSVAPRRGRRRLTRREGRNEHGSEKRPAKRPDRHGGGYAIRSTAPAGVFRPGPLERVRSRAPARDARRCRGVRQSRRLARRPKVPLRILRSRHLMRHDDIDATDGKRRPSAPGGFENRARGGRQLRCCRFQAPPGRTACSPADPERRGREADARDLPRARLAASCSTTRHGCGELAAWAQAMPRPKAILMVSAHWEQTPGHARRDAHRAARLRLLRLPRAVLRREVRRARRARARGARARALLGERRAVADDAERGLDHGAYVPLVAMYPEGRRAGAADVAADARAADAASRSAARSRRCATRACSSSAAASSRTTCARSTCGPAPSAGVGEGVRRVGRRRARAPRRRRAARLPHARARRARGAADARALRARHRRAGRGGRRPGPVTFPITGFSGGLTRRSVSVRRKPSDRRL